ncbi:hypothetical protein L1887_13068 [Cichorium endivia]|nr:hypothetical protein L1887_13068 [Cichorium endivia]
MKWRPAGDVESLNDLRSFKRWTENGGREHLILLPGVPPFPLSTGLQLLATVQILIIVSLSSNVTTTGDNGY